MPPSPDLTVEVAEDERLSFDDALADAAPLICQLCGDASDDGEELEEHAPRAFFRPPTSNYFDEQAVTLFIHEGCADDYLSTCSDCGTHVLIDLPYDSSRNPSSYERAVTGLGTLRRTDTHGVNDGDGEVCESCYQDNYRYCDRCDNAYHLDVLYDRNGERYCSPCHDEVVGEEEEEEEQQGGIFYRRWSPTPIGVNSGDGDWLRDSRTVGIEFEMMGYGDGHGVPAECGVHGEPSANIEVVTPPLAGQAGEEFVRRTLTALVTSGYHEGECGHHTHVAAPEFGQAPDRYGYNQPPTPAFYRFLNLWVAVEDLAFKFAPGRDGRWSRAYYRPPDTLDELWNNDQGMYMRHPTKAEAMAMLKEGRGPLARQARERYVSANMTALAEHGTVEFRLFPSTNNPDLSLGRAAFAQALIDLALTVTDEQLDMLGTTNRDDAALLLVTYMDEHNLLRPLARRYIGGVLGVPARELTPVG
jgi:hypothetical protein